MNKLFDMRRLLFILVFAATFVACERHSEHWTTITEMETIIEERPDSVLNVLQTIDTDELVGDEERAKHALLLSMAMDKNYIDRTDFEVLQPAIDYYEDNGSATDKLRTYYYQGRIHHNRGDEAAAMESYVKAINIGENSDDILTKARLFVAQGNIYNSLLRWDNAINANLQAAEYFYQMDKIDSFVNCNLKACNGYIQNDDYDNAQRILDKCSNYIDEVSNERLSLYYAAQLTLQIQTENNRNISTTIYEYFKSVPDANRNHLTIANAYIAIGENNKALDILEGRDYSSNISKEMKYYATLVAIYENLHNYQLAYEANKKFYELHDAHVYSVFEQDTQFVEERYNLEMAKARETEAKNRLTIIVLGCLVAVLTLIIVVYIIHKRLKVSRNKNILLENEKALYEQMYNEVVAERDALNEMIANNTIKEEAMEVIKKRLGVLNTIIVSHLSAKDTDIKRANEELERLIANRNDFIKSTRLTLEENYPHFFAYLHDKGLEEFEIDFCCLYAIGLKGKEIKAYTNLTRHYKNSSEVRQKLGLSESDTNLSIFLQKLLKKEGE